MLLTYLWRLAAVCLVVSVVLIRPTEPANAQVPPGPQRRLSRLPTSSEMQNRIPVQSAATMHNDVIEPVPLTARRLEAAREGVVQQIRDMVAELKEDIKPLFPDEIDALAGTGKWTADQRHALNRAIKSLDPPGVYQAWLDADPNNTTDAERLSRETAVRRNFNVLEQEAQEGSMNPDDIANLEDVLDKLAQLQPAGDQVRSDLQTLRTWAEVQKILAMIETEPAPVAKLPLGNVRLVYNPNLAFGTAIVLNENTVMIGNRGEGGVKVGRGNAAEAMGLPVIADNPVRDAEGAPVRNGALLFNPKTTGATVRYAVNGSAYKMEPGMSQWLPGGGSWVVEFDRGGNLGFSAYTLDEGAYTFTPTDTGWELYHQRYDVTIDNSRNPKDFHFAIDGERQVVRAGRTKTLSSRYPMVIRYDRGNGAKMARKTLNFCGTVEVAINGSDNLWDVFPEEGNKKRLLEVEIFP